MEKRIFVAVAVSIAFLWLWAAIAPRIFPELAKPVKPARATATAARPAAPPAAPRTDSSAALTPATASQPVSVSAVAATAVEEPVIETSEVKARFSNRGAQLISFQLKNYKNKDGSLVELVKTRARSRSDFPFTIESSVARDGERLNTALYEVVRGETSGSPSLEFHYAAADGLRATKVFQFTSPYLFKFDVDVAPVVPYRVMVGPGIRNVVDPEGTEGQAALLAGNGLVQEEGDLEVLAREKGDRLQIFNAPQFVGIEDNYFMAALQPVDASNAIVRRVATGVGKEARQELLAGLSAKPDGSVSGTAFFGPKETKLLDSYGLGEALQYGMFGVIARFLLEALVWINQYTTNYGFAIIVLTMLIKIVLYPLQHKSIVSMKKMQRLAPKMEVIKAKYKKAKTDPEQRQKMNVEMMQLYQKEKINPMSGCIPIILQMPILWGFYNLLSRAIELRGAPWILWIKDLADKDPTYVLPILMTATMFIQTWITPMTGDPAQRRIFLIMPLIFGIMFKEFPSGLVLYWLVQNVLTITQQLIMNKWWKDHPDELKPAS